MKHVDKIISALQKLYGKHDVITIAKGHPAVFELLIRTILAARNTDENALAASKELFAKYKTAQQISKAPLPVLEKLVKRGVFYKVKARSIKKLCEILVEKYKGRVPKTMHELVELPGVGRKTAGIVLIYGFGIVENVPIDTHCHRVFNRIGVIKEKTPETTEFAVMTVFPKKYWKDLNKLFVMHGRSICTARKPKCDICPIKKWCDYYDNVFKR